MRKLSFLAFACVILAAFASIPTPRVAGADPANEAPAVVWTDDYAAALAQAKKDGKMLMLDFTGSDWCGYCIKLHNQVFSKPEFATWANAKFILVELDFPAKKKLDDKVKQQNAALNKKYAIKGYPTIIVLDSDEKELTRAVGYGGDKPEAWMKKIDDGIAAGKAKNQ